MRADAVADAITAAINATYVTPKAFDIETAGTNPVDKIIVTVHRRFVPPLGFGGEVTHEGGRVVAQYVAARHGTVDLFRERVQSVLESRFLTVDGETVGPFVHETDLPTDRDETYFVGSTSFTFTV